VTRFVLALLVVLVAAAPASAVVGGVVHDTIGFAMHPGWRRANGPHNVLDDVAIVQLAQPVIDVAPVPLGGAPGEEARILGTGRFNTARMLWAVDVDGLAPLSSGCNGDSGGPLYSGTPQAPVLLGVVSWGGSRCGADRLPSVFAEVARYRDFIADVPFGTSAIAKIPR
jgi:hypothetical protein